MPGSSVNLGKVGPREVRRRRVALDVPTIERLPTRKITASETIDAVRDVIIEVGTDTGAITVTLPSAAQLGKVYIIKDVDNNAGTNAITIATEGSETIDGAATVSITVDFDQRGIFKGTDGNFFTG